VAQEPEIVPGGDTLNIYVVYDHPRDYPTKIVCRIQRVRRGVVWIDDDLFAATETIAEMETILARRGLTPFAPDPNDDPCILQWWM